jgi:hypothetical protein
VLVPHYDGEVLSWSVFGAIVAVAAVGLIILFGSLRRWQQPLPRTPEANAAEARLWTTKLGDQR